ILTDAGLTVDALRCPPSWPEDEPTKAALIRAGEAESRVRMNCSGKHAAMLAASAASGHPLDAYLDPGHPVQREVRRVLEECAEAKPPPVAVDGCGAPLFGLTLTGLARAARALVLSGDARPVADAMRAHPEYVGGTGHPNTEFMR